MPFDLAAWARADPAPIRWPDAAVAARLHDLDSELVLARVEERPVTEVCWAHGDSGSDDVYVSGGPPGVDCCWAIRERAAWTSDAGADAFFDALVEPSAASACAVATALAMDAVAPVKRARAALAALGDPGAAAFFSPRAAAVAAALLTHPEWTEPDHALHEWIARQAQIERGDRGDGSNSMASMRNGETWVVLEPVFERVIAEDASSPSPEMRARARATVAAWIEQVRAARGVRFTSAASARIPVARLFGVVALAPKVGLTGEARALLDGIGEDAAVARWVLDHPG